MGHACSSVQDPIAASSLLQAQASSFDENLQLLQKHFCKYKNIVIITVPDLFWACSIPVLCVSPHAINHLLECHCNTLDKKHS